MSVHLKGTVDTDSVESNASPLPDQILRLALVLDTQTNGATVTAANVMDAGGTADVFSFRNLQYTSRYIVLWDRTFVMKASQANMNEGGANLFSVAPVKMHFSVNKVFKTPINVQMAGTTADMANVTNNSLSIIGVGDNTTGNVAYQCRIRFVG